MRLWSAVCVVVMGLGYALPSASAAPSLASSFATPVWLQTVVLEDDPYAGWNQPAPPPVVEPAAEPAQLHSLDPATMAVQRRRFDKGRRIHTTGNVLFVVGTVAFVPSIYLVLIGVVADNPNTVVVGILGGMVSAGAIYTGGALSSAGALVATSAVNRGLGVGLSPGMGVAGVISTGAGIFFAPFVGPLLGVVFGTVQMAQANRVVYGMGLSSLRVVPIRNGLALNMRF